MQEVCSKEKFYNIDNNDNTRWDSLWQLRMRISGFREQKQLRRVTFGSLDWSFVMCVRVNDAVDFSKLSFSSNSC